MSLFSFTITFFLDKVTETMDGLPRVSCGQLASCGEKEASPRNHTACFDRKTALIRHYRQIRYQLHLHNRTICEHFGSSFWARKAPLMSSSLAGHLVDELAFRASGFILRLEMSRACVKDTTALMKHTVWPITSGPALQCLILNLKGL